MSVVIDTTRVAPRAKRRICVDFDLTLVDWGPLYEVPEPLPGAVEAVQALIDRGYEVVILTSRLSRTWWAEHCIDSGMDPDAFGRGQRAVVEESLTRMGLGGLRVTAEKVPALAYIDDRAVPFGGDWREVLRVIPEVQR